MGKYLSKEGLERYNEHIQDQFDDICDIPEPDIIALFDAGQQGGTATLPSTGSGSGTTDEPIPRSVIDALFE